MSIVLLGRILGERKRAEEQLRHQMKDDALHDSLTGLANRLLFMERLRLAYARAQRRQGYLFAVVFVDLDRFKLVNDSLGHRVGDLLLVQTAQPGFPFWPWHGRSIHPRCPEDHVFSC